MCEVMFKLIAFIAVVFSAEGFWLPDKPTPAAPANEIKTPVIIVPGTGGSQLQAKINKPDVPHWYCTKTTETYFTLWLKKTSLLPFAIDCWVDNMRYVTNAPGVETRVPGFGNTDTIDHLDTDNIVAYFSPMTDTLVSWGYKRGVTVRAAPYDFRYGPESQSDYFAKLKKLIEETYLANGNKSITLMSHSLGCPYSLIFLNKQPNTWKDKYIFQWITLSGVWGGAAEQVSLFSSGNTLGVPHFLLNPLTVRGEQRTDTSNIFLLPSPELWSGQEILATTPDRNYTVKNYDQFFEDIGFPLGKKLRKLVGQPSYPLTAHAPNVTVHCLFGTGVDTAESFSFGKGAFPDAQPKVFYGDGDGTVNIRSLQACHKWNQRQLQPVTLKTFHSVNHNGVLSDKNVHDYIKPLLI
ncbi:Phospholipase A2 group XV [Acropora cervicornis]|uniref:Phospholipase A2 group XV n=1 Tax=Acropora cervicornis TaxID=6130 RepID=A0AAD9QHN6_ACRCE|nr:Phospholipase A2 group XV [Acropora cervicornis]